MIFAAPLRHNAAEDSPKNTGNLPHYASAHLHLYSSGFMRHEALNMPFRFIAQR